MLSHLKKNAPVKHSHINIQISPFRSGRLSGIPWHITLIKMQWRIQDLIYFWLYFWRAFFFLARLCTPLCTAPPSHPSPHSLNLSKKGYFSVLYFLSFVKKNTNNWLDGNNNDKQFLPISLKGQFMKNHQGSCDLVHTNIEGKEDLRSSWSIKLQKNEIRCSNV